MYKTKIASTGMYVPPNVVTNDDLSKFFNTSDEWIIKRTGIRQRHYADDGVGASDLAFEATKEAIKNANLKPSDIDMIILGTTTPDITFPGSACLLLKKLDIQGIPVLDIRNQCSNFIYGLSIAEQFISSGKYKTVLVVGSETQSSGLDFSDQGRDVTVLFGDGAGAVICVREDITSIRGIIDFSIHADGSGVDSLLCVAPQSRRNPRISKEMIDNGLHYPKMIGKQVFVNAVEKLPKSILNLLEKHNFETKDIDWLIPHQANLRINEAIGKKLNIENEKIVSNIDRYGNTTSASVPIALHEMVSNCKIKENDLIVMAAFGAGFTWGSLLMRW